METFIAFYATNMRFEYAFWEVTYDRTCIWINNSELYYAIGFRLFLVFTVFENTKIEGVRVTPRIIFFSGMTQKAILTQLVNTRAKLNCVGKIAFGLKF